MVIKKGATCKGDLGHIMRMYLTQAIGKSAKTAQQTIRKGKGSVAGTSPLSLTRVNGKSPCYFCSLEMGGGSQ